MRAFQHLEGRSKIVSLRPAWDHKRPVSKTNKTSSAVDMETAPSFHVFAVLSSPSSISVCFCLLICPLLCYCMSARTCVCGLLEELSGVKPTGIGARNGGVTSKLCIKWIILFIVFLILMAYK